MKRVQRPSTCCWLREGWRGLLTPIKAANRLAVWRRFTLFTIVRTCGQSESTRLYTLGPVTISQFKDMTDPIKAMIGGDNSQTRSPWGVQVKQLTKICWHLTCSPPIHPILLWRGRFKPCLRPGYFLLRSSDCTMSDLHAVGWGQGPWALETPVKAIRVGAGL